MCARGEGNPGPRRHQVVLGIEGLLQQETSGTEPRGTDGQVKAGWQSVEQGGVVVAGTGFRRVPVCTFLS